MWPIWKRQNRIATGKTRANTQTIHSIRWYTLFDFRMEIYRPSDEAHSRVHWDDLCERTNKRRQSICTNQLHICACIGASINVFDYFYFTFAISFPLFLSLSFSLIHICLFLSHSLQFIAIVLCISNSDTIPKKHMKSMYTFTIANTFVEWIKQQKNGSQTLIIQCYSGSTKLKKPHILRFAHVTYCLTMSKVWLSSFSHSLCVCVFVSFSVPFYLAHEYLTADRINAPTMEDKTMKM